MRRTVLTLALIGLGLGAPYLMGPDLGALVGLASVALVGIYWVTSPVVRRLHPDFAVRLERQGQPADSAKGPSGNQTVDEFAGAPILRFVDPKAIYAGRVFEFAVWCENSGPLESVAVIMQREAAEDQSETSGQWVPWIFDEFPVGSMIHSVVVDAKRRFLLKMRATYQWSGTGRDHGIKRLKWTVAYKDNQMLRGYVTTASALVEYKTSGETRVIESTLDATSSPRVRHERYLEFVQRHGDPST